MGEEPSSSDSVTEVGGGATEASPGATTRADDGTSGRSAAEQRRAKAPRIIWLLAAMIVVGVPTVSMATENCTLWGESCRAAGTFSR